MPWITNMVLNLFWSIFIDRLATGGLHIKIINNPLRSLDRASIFSSKRQFLNFIKFRLIFPKRRKFQSVKGEQSLWNPLNVLWNVSQSIKAISMETEREIAKILVVLTKTKTRLHCHSSPKWNYGRHRGRESISHTFQDYGKVSQLEELGTFF